MEYLEFYWDCWITVVGGFGTSSMGMKLGFSNRIPSQVYYNNVKKDKVNAGDVGKSDNHGPDPIIQAVHQVGPALQVQKAPQSHTQWPILPVVVSWTGTLENSQNYDILVSAPFSVFIMATGPQRQGPYDISNMDPDFSVILLLYNLKFDLK